ncbi:hypothetical protein WME73_36275 [Sorangium sp. So ce302]|uniref:hypothetical protein n=1 Tax=Sorangium sp. So ce302 TaxID=3133297 RepID=UPI003F5D7719
MPSRVDLRSRIAALSANLSAHTGPERDAVIRLEELLAHARFSDLAAEDIAGELSVDRVSWDIPSDQQDERNRRLSDLTSGAREDDHPRYRVFRREAPLSAPAIGLTTPAWGRGAAIDQTLGPFDGIDGRLFWFDFYRLIGLVPIYLEGDPSPALLFQLDEHLLEPGKSLSIRDVLRLLNRRQYDIGPSTVWLRADLLTPSAPSGTFVGLRGKGGQLVFSPPPVDAGGKLTVPSGGSCHMHLNLRVPAAARVSGGRAGIDAAEALIALPDTFSFVLASGRAAVTAVGCASWELYGQPIGFEWRQGASPFFEPSLQSVVIPMSPSASEIGVDVERSPFANVEGSAPIRRAGWALPVAAIDVAHPTEAAGSGALAVQAESGLTLGWSGLREGPIRLPRPWIVLSPELVFITDPRASSSHAHQKLRLWKDEDSRFRSGIDLRYSDSFDISYLSASTGSEVVLALTNAEARLDRPVDVTGTPLPIRMLSSLLLLGYTDTVRMASLYDDNILVDSLDPRATWPLAGDRERSVAIRNALFIVTPVNSLLLFARLLDEERVDRAVLVLGMGLYGLLPTLPDPYAANIGTLRRYARRRQRARQVGALLLATVDWRKAADDEKPDHVHTSFAFAAIAGQDRAFAAWASATRATSAPPRSSLEVEPRVASTETLASSGDPRSNERDWARLFERFEAEEFALLDVSSRADQMGVSFAWFDASTLDEDDYIFFRIYGVRDGSSLDAAAIPLKVRGMDLSAEGRYVRAFTAPQVSWEPLVNRTTPRVIGGTPPYDPPSGGNYYPNDGGPTRLLNNSVELVAIAPLTVAEFLFRDFQSRRDGFTGALFTLPFGLRAFAEFSRQNQFAPDLPGAKLELNQPEYEDGAVKGGLQLRVDAPEHPAESPIFMGSTLQLENVLGHGGRQALAGTLGRSVGIVFNNEFFYGSNIGYKRRGVPLARIDFSGYGASIFSHWQNPNAAIAATSQAHFEVIVGRTAHEVIQVRSLVYPWGFRVVRTITLLRMSSGYVFRDDTGWEAESDGLYDFRYNVYRTAATGDLVVVQQPNPYAFHPGVVRGVFRVRNIRETTAVPRFESTWNKNDGDSYVDDDGVLRTVDSSTPSEARNPAVELQPIYFDADVGVDGVKSGAGGGRVPSKGILGYVQIAPRGEPLPPELFALLLTSQLGAIGGPVDCVVDIGGSGQHMRLSRVDVNSSADTGGKPIFVSAARGAVILPRDGAWSVVQHTQATGEVSPLDPQAAVPLIRRGLLDTATQTTDASPADLLRLADPKEIVQAPTESTRNYGLLHSTETQKALFRLPSFKEGVDQLLGAPPDFADAYRIINSPGIFPNVQDALPLALGAFQTKILAEGYRLLDQANPDAVFEQALPEGPLYLINESFLKVYVEYAKKNKHGNTMSPGHLRYGFDSSASDVGKRWLSKVNDIGMVVDLGPLDRLIMIKGKLDAEKGRAPAFKEPQIEFSDALKPVIEILQLLQQLQGGDYQEAFQKGLEVAMSNSADSWTYAFHARKEIPVVKFPPGPLYDEPLAPLKLEAHLALGVYFNEALKVTTDPRQLIPSAGAFLEFGGRLSVMCVSVGIATVYATGSVDLRISADIKTGRALFMKFGFGAEVVAALPVVANVSLLFMVGVEIVLDSSQLTISGFLLFRGRAEILGGIVSITIQIEAKGSVKRLEAQNRTDMIAQVTFGLDISIFLVINIHFSESWQESRQIA